MVNLMEQAAKPQADPNFDPNVGMVRDLTLGNGKVVKQSVATGRIWLGPENSTLSTPGWYDRNDVDAGPAPDGGVIPGGVTAGTFRGMPSMRHSGTGAWWVDADPAKGYQQSGWYLPDMGPDHTIVEGQRIPRAPKDKYLAQLPVPKKDGVVIGITKAVGRGLASNVALAKDLATSGQAWKDLGTGLKTTLSNMARQNEVTGLVGGMDVELPYLSQESTHDPKSILKAMGLRTNEERLAEVAESRQGMRFQNPRFGAGAHIPLADPYVGLDAEAEKLLTEFNADGQGMSKDDAKIFARAFRHTLAQRGHGDDSTDLRTNWMRFRGEAVAKAGVDLVRMAREAYQANPNAQTAKGLAQAEKTVADIQKAQTATASELEQQRAMNSNAGQLGAMAPHLATMILASQNAVNAMPGLGAGAGKAVSAALPRLGRYLPEALRSGVAMQLASGVDLTNAAMDQMEGSDPKALKKYALQRAGSFPMDAAFGTPLGRPFNKLATIPGGTAGKMAGDALNTFVTRPVMLGATGAVGKTTAMALGGEQTHFKDELEREIEGMAKMEAMTHAVPMARGLKGAKAKYAKQGEILSSRSESEGGKALLDEAHTMAQAYLAGTKFGSLEELANKGKLEPEQRDKVLQLQARIDALQALVHRGNMKADDNIVVAPGQKTVTPPKPEKAPVVTKTTPTRSGTVSVTAPAPVAEKVVEAVAPAPAKARGWDGKGIDLTRATESVEKLGEVKVAEDSTPDVQPVNVGDLNRAATGGDPKPSEKIEFAPDSDRAAQAAMDRMSERIRKEEAFRRGRPSEVWPITEEAEFLLAGLGEGSAPAFISKKLEIIARENGIRIDGKTRPEDIISALQDKVQNWGRTEKMAPPSKVEPAGPGLSDKEVGAADRIRALGQRKPLAKEKPAEPAPKPLAKAPDVMDERQANQDRNRRLAEMEEQLNGLEEDGDVGRAIRVQSLLKSFRREHPQHAKEADAIERRMTEMVGEEDAADHDGAYSFRKRSKNVAGPDITERVETFKAQPLELEPEKRKDQVEAKLALQDEIGNRISELMNAKDAAGNPRPLTDAERAEAGRLRELNGSLDAHMGQKPKASEVPKVNVSMPYGERDGDLYTTLPKIERFAEGLDALVKHQKVPVSVATSILQLREEALAMVEALKGGWRVGEDLSDLKLTAKSPEVVQWAKDVHDVYRDLVSGNYRQSHRAKTWKMSHLDAPLAERNIIDSETKTFLTSVKEPESLDRSLRPKPSKDSEVSREPLTRTVKTEDGAKTLPVKTPSARLSSSLQARYGEKFRKAFDHSRRQAGEEGEHWYGDPDEMTRSMTFPDGMQKALVRMSHRDTVADLERGIRSEAERLALAHEREGNPEEARKVRAQYGIADPVQWGGKHPIAGPQQRRMTVPADGLVETDQPKVVKDGKELGGKAFVQRRDLDAEPSPSKPVESSVVHELRLQGTKEFPGLVQRLEKLKAQGDRSGLGFNQHPGAFRSARGLTKGNLRFGSDGAPILDAKGVPAHGLAPRVREQIDATVLPPERTGGPMDNAEDRTGHKDTSEGARRYNREDVADRLTHDAAVDEVLHAWGLKAEPKEGSPERTKFDAAVAEQEKAWRPKVGFSGVRKQREQLAEGTRVAHEKAWSQLTETERQDAMGSTGPDVEGQVPKGREKYADLFQQALKEHQTKRARIEAAGKRRMSDPDWKPSEEFKHLEREDAHELLDELMGLQRQAREDVREREEAEAMEHLNRRGVASAEDAKSLFEEKVIEPALRKLGLSQDKPMSREDIQIAHEKHANDPAYRKAEADAIAELVRNLSPERLMGKPESKRESEGADRLGDFTKRLEAAGLAIDTDLKRISYTDPSGRKRWLNQDVEGSDYKGLTVKQLELLMAPGKLARQLGTIAAQEANIKRHEATGRPVDTHEAQYEGHTNELSLADLQRRYDETQTEWRNLVANPEVFKTLYETGVIRRSDLLPGEGRFREARRAMKTAEKQLRMGLEGEHDPEVRDRLEGVLATMKRVASQTIRGFIQPSQTAEARERVPLTRRTQIPAEIRGETDWSAWEEVQRPGVSGNLAVLADKVIVNRTLDSLRRAYGEQWKDVLVDGLDAKAKVRIRRTLDHMEEAAQYTGNERWLVDLHEQTQTRLGDPVRMPEGELSVADKHDLLSDHAQVRKGVQDWIDAGEKREVREAEWTELGSPEADTVMDGTESLKAGAPSRVDRSSLPGAEQTTLAEKAVDALAKQGYTPEPERLEAMVSSAMEQASAELKGEWEATTKAKDAVSNPFRPGREDVVGRAIENLQDILGTSEKVPTDPAEADALLRRLLSQQDMEPERALPRMVGQAMEQLQSEGIAHPDTQAVVDRAVANVRSALGLDYSDKPLPVQGLRRDATLAHWRDTGRHDLVDAYDHARKRMGVDGEEGMLQTITGGKGATWSLNPYIEKFAHQTPEMATTLLRDAWGEGVRSQLALDGSRQGKGLKSGASGVEEAAQRFRRILTERNGKTYAGVEHEALSPLEIAAHTETFRTHLRDVAEVMDAQRTAHANQKLLKEFFGNLDPKLLVELQKQIRPTFGEGAEGTQGSFDRWTGEIVVNADLNRVAIDMANDAVRLAKIMGTYTPNTLRKSTLKSRPQASIHAAETLVHEASHFLASYVMPGMVERIQSGFGEARDAWMDRHESEGLKALFGFWEKGEGGRLGDMRLEAKDLVELRAILGKDLSEAGNGDLRVRVTGNKFAIFGQKHGDRVDLSWPGTSELYRWHSPSEFVSEAFASLLSKGGELAWMKDVHNVGKLPGEREGGNLAATILDLVDGTGAVLEASTLAGRGLDPGVMKGKALRSTIDRMGESALGDIPSKRKVDGGAAQGIKGTVRDLMLDAIGESRFHNASERRVTSGGYATFNSPARAGDTPKPLTRGLAPVQFRKLDQPIELAGQSTFYETKAPERRRFANLLDFLETGMKNPALRAASYAKRGWETGDGLNPLTRAGRAAGKTLQGMFSAKAGVPLWVQAVAQHAQMVRESVGTMATGRVFGTALGVNEVLARPSMSGYHSAVESIVSREVGIPVRKAVEKMAKRLGEGLHDVYVPMPDGSKKRASVRVDAKGKAVAFDTPVIQELYRYLESGDTGRPYEHLSAEQRKNLDDFKRDAQAVNDVLFDYLETAHGADPQAVAEFRERTQKAGRFYVAHLYGTTGSLDLVSFDADPGSYSPDASRMSRGKGHLEERTFETYEQARQHGYLPMFANPLEAWVEGVRQQMNYVTNAEALNHYKDAGLVVLASDRVMKGLRNGSDFVEGDSSIMHGIGGKLMGLGQKDSLTTPASRAIYAQAMRNMMDHARRNLPYTFTPEEQAVMPKVFIHKDLQPYYMSQWGVGIGHTKVYQDVQQINSRYNVMQLLSLDDPVTRGLMFGSIWNLGRVASRMPAAALRAAAGKLTEAVIREKADPSQALYNRFRKDGLNDAEAKQAVADHVVIKAGLQGYERNGFGMQRLISEHGWEGIEGLKVNKELHPEDRAVLAAAMLTGTGPHREHAMENARKKDLTGNIATLQDGTVAQKLGAVLGVGTNVALHVAERVQANFQGGWIARTKLGLFRKEALSLIREHPEYHKPGGMDRIIQEMQDANTPLFKNLNSMASRLDDAFGMANFLKYAMDPSVKGLAQMWKRAYSWGAGTNRLLFHAGDEAASLASRGLGRLLPRRADGTVMDAYGRTKEAFGGRRMAEGEKAYGLRFLASHLAGTSMVNLMIGALGIAAMGHKVTPSNEQEGEASLFKRWRRSLYLLLGEEERPRLDRNGVPYYIGYGYTNDWTEALDSPGVWASQLGGRGLSPVVQIAKQSLKIATSGKPDASSAKPSDMRDAQMVEFDQSGKMLEQKLANLFLLGDAQTRKTTKPSYATQLAMLLAESGDESALDLALKRSGRVVVSAATDFTPMMISSARRAGRLGATNPQSLGLLLGGRISNTEERDLLAGREDETKAP